MNLREETIKVLREAIDEINDSVQHTAALAALSRLEAGSGEETGWQPIETAPKDGTQVDLFGTRNNEPMRFTDASWKQDAIGGQHIDRWSWHHLGRDIYGEFEYTNWRHLPPRPHVATPAPGENSGRADISDPIERIVACALTAAGIRWTAGNNDQRLDFDLPDAGLKIECKQFPTPRTAGQIANEPNVIVVQGREAAKWFARQVTGRRSGLEETGDIYIASKTEHAHRWRFLRDKIGEPIISTWIDEAGSGETSDWQDLWTRCIGEASRAAITIVNHEPGEVLKGALVEVGAALANGRKVLVVGDPPGSWVKHRNVERCASMKDAIARARELRAALSRPEGSASK